MSSNTLPISPTAFASALKDLPLSALHLKAAELRNSTAHLDYSNEQLRPFALGTEPGLNAPDEDCVDAIKENEVVIARMEERIRLLKKEVEERGQVWVEGIGNGELDAELGVGMFNEEVEGAGEERSSAWTDGTFTTGRISRGDMLRDGSAAPMTNGTGVNGNSAPTAISTNGAGGRLDDVALRRAMEERTRDLATEDDDDAGIHL
ncbi:hypothetical protein BJ878DRAFT_499438 [Calycina marina]|uniref:Uncharacterized protein n=1 Tax=Calycina marina TaxID=1763456 RepID=A0A9P8CG58_9HELO|nr:hypothetical protein BJ878DRAFT_499438 [Calycina marina]